MTASGFFVLVSRSVNTCCPASAAMALFSSALSTNMSPSIAQSRLPANRKVQSPAGRGASGVTGKSAGAAGTLAGPGGVVSADGLEGVVPDGVAGDGVAAGVPAPGGVCGKAASGGEPVAAEFGASSGEGPGGSCTVDRSKWIVRLLGRSTLWPLPRVVRRTVDRMNGLLPRPHDELRSRRLGLGWLPIAEIEKQASHHHGFQTREDPE